jgi:ABC-type oligopeptide transport system substrate-binding subunit
MLSPRKISLALILTAALTLLGCRSVASNISRELHLNLGIEPATIDPALATDPGSQQIARMLFLSLVDSSAATGAPEHAFAISWAVSSDGLIWEFKLRNDAFWVMYNPPFDASTSCDRSRRKMLCTRSPRIRSAGWLWICASLRADDPRSAGINLHRPQKERG